MAVFFFSKINNDIDFSSRHTVIKLNALLCIVSLNTNKKIKTKISENVMMQKDPQNYKILKLFLFYILH